MQILRDLASLREVIQEWREKGQKIALVPTMGALHAGHMGLIKAAKKHGDKIVASIFVNPKQFGANEDLSKYPRREASDADLLKTYGCDLLWAPTVDVMYPQGFATTISVSGVSEGLCGGSRPGHFDGVATVVAKLFGQVAPDVALFGEKDFQQLAVIRRLVLDLDMNISIIGVPTERDDDGVALSSRNAYLTDAERQQARALPRALGEAASQIEQGKDIVAILSLLEAKLLDGGFSSVDYVALVDSLSLKPIEKLEKPARLLVAAKIGSTRLIDNVQVNPQ